MTNFPRRDDPWTRIAALERHIARLEASIAYAPRIQSGLVYITFSASTDGSAAVTFARPFPVTATVSVSLIHRGGLGFTSYSVDGVTPAGFLARARYNVALTGTWAFLWTAAG